MLKGSVAPVWVWLKVVCLERVKKKRRRTAEGL
jgi:hypothetical protein